MIGNKHNVVFRKICKSKLLANAHGLNTVFFNFLENRLRYRLETSKHPI